MQGDMGDYNSIGGMEHDQQDAPKWYYMGQDTMVHGAFTDSQMQKWFDIGYFGDRMPIKTIEDDKFYSLYEYQQICNGSPFLGNVYSVNHILTECYERQQSATPIPLVPLPPMMIQTHRPTTQGYTPAATPMYISPPNSSFTNMQPSMIMVPPPGMDASMTTNEGYEHDHQMFNRHPRRRRSRDVYGVGEREHPSSSSVSETPDSERCLNMVEDVQLTVLQTDKCVGTEDAPWLSEKVDAGTDAPPPGSNSRSCASQTAPIFLRKQDVTRILRELTGLHYRVGY